MIEVDDDMTDKELEETMQEAMFEMIDWGYVPASEYKKSKW